MLINQYLRPRKSFDGLVIQTTIWDMENEYGFTNPTYLIRPITAEVRRRRGKVFRGQICNSAKNLFQIPELPLFYIYVYQK